MENTLLRINARQNQGADVAKIAAANALAGTSTSLRRPTNSDAKQIAPQRLFKRNLEFFRRYVEPVYKRFEPFLSDEMPSPRPARARHKTMRFTGSFPERTDVDVFTFALLHNTLTRCDMEGIPFFDQPRTPEAFYLLVVGIPTNREFEQIMREFKPRCILLNEGDLSLLARSMWEVDWARHIFLLHQAGGEIHFLIDERPETAAGNAWRLCRRVNPSRADNFTCLILDHHQYGEAVAQALSSDLSLVGSHLGFFQDELLMQWNNFANLKSGKARIYNRGDHVIDAPVFVVGCGPSLDDDLDFIREHQDRAVIVSAGSALRPLVNAGIKPDFQIENENCGVQFRFEHVAEEHDISGIKLVASSTVEQEAVNAVEDDAILYYRIALSPFPVHSSDANNSLRLPDPTVGNAALCFALEAGFKDVYMFGLDLGSRDSVHHHSKRSFYHTLDGVTHDTAYNIPVPGNFQETVWTSRFFHPAIKNLSDLAIMLGKGRRIVNCSDGAKISGTESVRRADIEVAKPNASKADVIAELVQQFPKANTDVTWDGEAYEAALTRFGKAFRTCLNNDEAYFSGAYQADLMRLLDLRKGFLEAPDDGIDDSVMILYRGTLLALVLFLEFYSCRAASPADERRFREIAREELLRVFDFMEELALFSLGGDAPEAPPPLEERMAPEGVELPTMHRQLRNQSCGCGSGRKYKHCHGKAA